MALNTLTGPSRAAKKLRAAAIKKWHEAHPDQEADPGAKRRKVVSHDFSPLSEEAQAKEGPTPDDVPPKDPSSTKPGKRKRKHTSASQPIFAEGAECRQYGSGDGGTMIHVLPFLSADACRQIVQLAQVRSSLSLALWAFSLSSLF